MCSYNLVSLIGPSRNLLVFVLSLETCVSRLLRVESTTTGTPVAIPRDPSLCVILQLLTFGTTTLSRTKLGGRRVMSVRVLLLESVARARQFRPRKRTRSSPWIRALLLMTNRAVVALGTQRV